MTNHTNAEIFEEAIKQVPQVYLDNLQEYRVQVVFPARDESDVIVNRRYIYDVLLRKLYSEGLTKYEWELAEIYTTKFELITPNQ